MNKLIIVVIMIIFASCKSTDNCPAYTTDNLVIEEDGVIWYGVINGDSVRNGK